MSYVSEIIYNDGEKCSVKGFELKVYNTKPSYEFSENALRKRVDCFFSSFLSIPILYTNGMIQIDMI